MGSSESTGQDDTAQGADLSSDSAATREWKWPEWALDRRSQAIEVFVLDENHRSGGAWVRAKAKMRVVDDRGSDAYLSAEYRWKGEVYDEDFGPDRVRRCGEEATVWELISLGMEDCLRSASSRPPQPKGEPSLGSRAPVRRREPAREASGEDGQSQPEGPQLCAVCMDKPCDSILAPCLHGGLCEKCAKRIANNGATGGARCPHCRTIITGVTKVGVRQQRNPVASGNKKKTMALEEAAKKWNWPPWCQSKRPDTLEVFVMDTQAKRSEWVTALPRMSVVDGRGEKYLCAEYTWDGECYAEDFGTDRIRRRGEVLTLKQQLLLDGVFL